MCIRTNFVMLAYAYCDCLPFGKGYPKQYIISSDQAKEVDVSKLNENVAPTTHGIMCLEK